MNEEDSDVKFDVDPTDTMTLKFTTDITYKQIFLEVKQFINNNNNNKNNNSNKINGRYLQFPQFYLDSKKPKCKDTKKCAECDSNSMRNYSNNKNHNGYNSIFNLCLTKRREMADKLLDIAQAKQCVTDSLTATARPLCAGDILLKRDSMGYKLNPNWFINLYSFLQWQKEAAHALLQNLIQVTGMNLRKDTVNVVDEYEDDEKKAIDNRLIDVSTKDVEDGVFLFHSYLDQLIEYLVLYYTCFDDKSWIAVFYPFIEAAIGKYYCKMLFAELGGYSYSKDVLSICSESLNFDDSISTKQKSISKQRCLDEMRAISTFKRLLLDIYQGDSDDKEHNNNNAFDLSHKIYIKLQETVNNIKSQLTIHEMTGKNVYETDHGYTSDDKSVTQERKDDWDIGEKNNMNEEEVKIEAPSFVRLFVIRRVIKNYVQNCNIKEKTAKIEKLTCVFAKNTETKSMVFDIVTRLVNHGIRKYMNKWYQDEKQPNIIEMIFKNIILTQFKKEYNTLMTYVANDRNMMLVFNSSDLMCEIFQYLDYGMRFDGDLVRCSLVNSHWLYNAWNLNSIYFVDLTSFMDSTLYNQINMGVVIRMLQRFIHARHIFIDNVGSNAIVSSDKRVLNGLMMFGRLKKVDFSSDNEYKDVALLKALMWKCCQKIEWCNIAFYETTLENQLSPLTLTNASHIEICDLYFYRVWTDKCKSLVLYMKNVSQTWYQYVVKHCHCSNVKYLELILLRYDDDKEANDDMGMVLLRFAAKFTSLDKLKVEFRKNFDKNMLVLWQLVQGTINKNNGCVEVAIDRTLDKFSNQEATFLNNTIQKQDLKMDSLVTVYPDGELSDRIIDKWVVGGLIASGGFGNVYQATHVENQITAAVKFIPKKGDTDKQEKRKMKMIRNEIASLSKAKHSNVIKLLDYYVDVTQPAMLVFEYMKNGDLQQYLTHSDRFELAICKRIFNQIVDGLYYLHSKLHIAHTDLKPSNILLDDQFNIKIAHFSLCKTFDTYNSNDKDRSFYPLTRGTGYTAPEMNLRLNSIIYDSISNQDILSCDIFSLGIILWKMLMGIDSKPFEDFEFHTRVTSDYPRYMLIVDKKYDDWWKLFKNHNAYYNDNDLKRLFIRLFDPFPTSRITINDIKKDDWYKKKAINKTHNQDYFIAEMQKVCAQKEIFMNTLLSGGLNDDITASGSPKQVGIDGKSKQHNKYNPGHNYGQNQAQQGVDAHGQAQTQAQTQPHYSGHQQSSRQQMLQLQMQMHDNTVPDSSHSNLNKPKQIDAKQVSFIQGMKDKIPLIKITDVTFMQEIGRGQFSRVYDAKWGLKRVAVKLFAPDQNNGDSFEYFKSNIDIAALLPKHDNILKMYVVFNLFNIAQTDETNNRMNVMYF